MRDPKTLGTGTSLMRPSLVEVMTRRRCRARVPPVIWMVSIGGNVIGFQSPSRVPVSGGTVNEPTGSIAVIRTYSIGH